VTDKYRGTAGRLADEIAYQLVDQTEGASL